jgi:predicted secreted Zn-dependent protease
MKITLLALTALTAIAATGASASGIKGTPYTFTGSVVTATGACDYPAKAKLAGYTLINFQNEYGPKGQVKQVIAHPSLIFSPGGNANKLAMRLEDLPAHTGALSGNASIVLLPSTNGLNGTYKGSIDVAANKSFTLVYTLTYKKASGNCTTKYNLSFAKGLPTNLFNLL